MESQFSKLAALLEKAVLDSEELKKRTAALERPATATGAANSWFRPVAPSPGVQAMAATAPTPDQPHATGVRSYEPLKPLHHKHVEIPIKYTGDAGMWLMWSKSFRKFLRRIDVRWPELLDKVEGFRGKPLTAGLELEWAQ